MEGTRFGFIIKAFECLDIIGRECAGEVFPTVLIKKANAGE
jgi:hypothetical protein